MGLSPKEMRNRTDSVIDFAELSEFADLKLKNYSSGMLVRLAFAVMLEADADVLLIDEVLAVGDASFQQKCADAFHQMKTAGKTIVLVTHEMSSVEAYCHRAMLISDGEIKYLGAPKEAGRRYLKLNFAKDEVAASEEMGDEDGQASEGGEGARLVNLQVLDATGEGTATLEMGEPIRIEAEIELLEKTPGLHMGLVIANADDISMFELSVPIQSADGYDIKGNRVTITASVENPFAPGRHFLHCGLQSPFGISVYLPKAATFVIFGSHPSSGIVAPSSEFQVKIPGEDA
jgi:ABC-2 type transport system ATP-binding protein